MRNNPDMKQILKWPLARLTLGRNHPSDKKSFFFQRAEAYAYRKSLSTFLEYALVAALFILATCESAAAHAFLDHAAPGVGGTVQAAPAELLLSFTQNVVVAFSGVTLEQEGGGSIPVAKPVTDAASASTLHVRLPKGLKPGTYVVSWHVVSVDTHKTSGTYRFTVAP